MVMGDEWLVKLFFSRLHKNTQKDFERLRRRLANDPKEETFSEFQYYIQLEVCRNNNFTIQKPTSANLSSIRMQLRRGHHAIEGLQGQDLKGGILPTVSNHIFFQSKKTSDLVQSTGLN